METHNSVNMSLEPIRVSGTNLYLSGVAEEDQGIDQSNVIQGDNLRHAKPQTSNGYNEGPSEDDLPQEAL